MLYHGQQEEDTNGHLEGFPLWSEGYATEMSAKLCNRYISCPWLVSVSQHIY
jgi:hypothetical protein